MGEKAIFLDRDDTLMVNVPYLNDPSGVKLFPETRNELKRLKAANYRLIIISNQSGVARGLCTLAEVQAVNQELERQLAPVILDAIYISPDGPDDKNSLTRKPAPGLIFQARDEFKLNLKDCFMIGDKALDVECGKSANCQTIHLQRSGSGDNLYHADFVAKNLTDAADWILKR